MDDSIPKKAWWRKKRWVAAAGCALAFPVLYPASLGVVGYATGREIISDDTEMMLFATVYRPLAYTLDSASESPALECVAEPLDHYYSSMRELGEEYDEVPPAPVVRMPGGVAADQGVYVGVDFDFAAQDTVRPVTGRE